MKNSKKVSEEFDIKNLKILLLYPPEQNWPDTMCKPNGSLAYPMIGGALLEAGYDTHVFDACVGNDKDDLNDMFYKSTPLPSGMLRTGVSNKRILEEVADYDVIGITSIFSHQETMALDTIRLIKKNLPNKLIITGGVNARHRMKKFFDAGVDLICTSEAENTIVDICQAYEKGVTDFSNIPRVVFSHNGVPTFSTARGDIIWNLDDLPLPAWNLLPNERYWKIGRPHGGHFNKDEELKYASMVTSMGCPFSCTFCHIAGETNNSSAGPIGRFRIKSNERVMHELDILRDLGVKQIFIEDDSLLGKKRRAVRLIKKVIGSGFEILDVNGVNIVHLLKDGQPDIELIELLAEVGFRDIVLPFESANPRIIKKYCSNKWDISNSNVTDLIKVCKQRGLRIAGNFMLGYPDESLEEVMNTVYYASERMSDGLDAANFFLVMPLPGTPMFDEAVAKGQLPKNYNPDKMHWQKANMFNTPVAPDKLEEIRDKAWLDINNKHLTDYKKDMKVDINTGEVHVNVAVSDPIQTTEPQSNGSDLVFLSTSRSKNKKRIQ